MGQNKHLVNHFINARFSSVPCLITGGYIRFLEKLDSRNDMFWECPTLYVIRLQPRDMAVLLSVVHTPSARNPRNDRFLERKMLLTGNLEEVVWGLETPIFETAKPRPSRHKAFGTYGSWMFTVVYVYVDPTFCS